MSAGPQPFRWDGEAASAAPARSRSRVCRRAGIHARRRGTALAQQHRMFFASVTECWRNLPDDLADEYPDAETLRKKALIRCGFRDERSIVCASKAEPFASPLFIAPIDRYAIVVQANAVVRVWTARTSPFAQWEKPSSGRIASRKVLAFCADLIGVSVGDLQKAEAA